MAGRKPKYKTAKELQQAVDAYFAGISYQAPAVVSTPTGEVDEHGNVKYKTIMLCEDGGGIGMRGKPITVTKWLKPPSMAGLCLHLGISKETWSNYAGQEKFLDVVDRVRARMEDYWTERLDGKGAHGARFALSSCYGWSGERGTVQVEGQVRDVKSLDLSKLTTEELEKLLARANE